MLTEAKRDINNVVEFTFASDNVPAYTALGNITLVEPSAVKAKSGAEVEIGMGYTTLRFPARKTKYWTFAHGKYMTDEAKKVYSELFSQYMSIDQEE